MENYLKGTRLTHAPVTKTTVLALAFLAALSTTSAAQMGGPSPAEKGAPSPTSQIPESIRLKIDGTSYVYSLSETDKANLAAHPPSKHHKVKKVFMCRVEFGGLTCS